MKLSTLSIVLTEVYALRRPDGRYRRECPHPSKEAN